MTHDPRPNHADAPADGAAVDKLELHARQQLSALVDGELSPDEARFLLRRLNHDTELSGSFERWQLCGDVLRGQVRRTVAPDFSARVAAAIAVAPAVDARQVASGGRRFSVSRWGGGAALAASVAAVAMLVGRPGAPDPASAPAAPAIAMQTLPSTEAVLPSAAPAPATAIAATSVPTPRAAAPARVQREPLQQIASASTSAASTGAAARRASVPAAQVAIAQSTPEAATATLAPTTDPFASSAPLQARPWPRAALAGPSSGYTASLESQEGTRTFYPFEPSLPAQPVAPDGADPDELPAPPDDDGTR